MRELLKTKWNKLLERSPAMTLIIQLLVLLFLSGTVQAQGGGWEKEWNRILAAAKKEKSVVVVGSPDRVLRVKLPAAFKNTDSV